MLPHMQHNALDGSDRTFACAELVECWGVQTRAVLKRLRAAIEKNNGYVLGSFTYADITMAVRGLAARSPIPGPPRSHQYPDGHHLGACCPDVLCVHISAKRFSTMAFLLCAGGGASSRACGPTLLKVRTLCTCFWCPWQPVANTHGWSRRW